VVLRLKFGNVRMLFAGDLNNAAEEALLAEHAAGRIDLESEILKVPHHGSHEFTPGFLAASHPWSLWCRPATRPRAPSSSTRGQPS
jgi:competence protein ComEC